MKRILYATVALATLIASPGLAQQATSKAAQASVRAGSGLVIWHGRIYGQDPDPNVRFAILREAYHGDTRPFR